MILGPHTPPLSYSDKCKRLSFLCSAVCSYCMMQPIVHYSQYSWLANTYSEPKQPSRNKSPYKVRVVFSKPDYAARARIGHLGANCGPFTAKPSSYHVHRTLWVTPPISPCPTRSRTHAQVCSNYIFCAVRSTM